MGRDGAGDAVGQRAGRTRRSPSTPRRDVGRQCRAAPHAGRLRLRRQRHVCAAAGARYAQLRARRGRYRNRQDPRLYRPGEPVGRAQWRTGMDQHLHAQSAEPNRPGTRPSVSRSPVESLQSGYPQGPRELSVPAQHGGGGRTVSRLAPARCGRSWPVGALGGGNPRRRFRRRLSGLADRSGGDGRHHIAVGSARRMHLLILPALFEMLHRA